MGFDTASLNDGSAAMLDFVMDRAIDSFGSINPELVCCARAYGSATVIRIQGEHYSAAPMPRKAMKAFSGRGFGSEVSSCAKSSTPISYDRQNSGIS